MNHKATSASGPRTVNGLRPLRLVEKHCKPLASTDSAASTSPTNDVSYGQPTSSTQNVKDSVEARGAPLQRASTHYDINERFNMARQWRLEQASQPQAQAAEAGPATAPFRLLELPKEDPSEPSSLPYLQGKRVMTTQEQHEMAIEALKAQGSLFPDLLRAAERNHPLIIPPQRSSSLQAKKPVASRLQNLFKKT